MWNKETQEIKKVYFAEHSGTSTDNQQCANE